MHKNVINSNFPILDIISGSWAYGSVVFKQNKSNIKKRRDQENEKQPLFDLKLLPKDLCNFHSKNRIKH